MSRLAKENAGWAALVAVVMLVYASWGTISTSSNPTYSAAVKVFDWMLWLGGGAFLVVAIIGFFGLRLSLLLSVMACAACGLILAACSVCWIALGSGVDLFDLLALIMGCLLLKSAHTAWSWYRTEVGGGHGMPPAEGGATPVKRWFRRREVVPPAPSPPEPPHPASIRPSGLPDDGSPPPEGYLAALAREDDPPPARR